MTMLKELDDYDWGEVFAAAGESGGCNQTSLQSAAPEHLAEDVAEFTREDVVEILAMVEGENDMSDWQIVCRLKDGRYAYLTGGCDYTGWD